MSFPDALVSALVSRYTIEREVGSGGMATVYLTHDVKHDRKVAGDVYAMGAQGILLGDRAEPR